MPFVVQIIFITVLPQGAASSQHVIVPTLVGGGVEDDDGANDVSQTGKRLKRRRGRSSKIGRKVKVSRPRTTPDVPSASLAASTLDGGEDISACDEPAVDKHTRRKEYINAWKATPKGRESVSRSKKKYSATESGADAKKDAQSKYVRTESGADAKKDAQSKYLTTESGADAKKDAQSKYVTTESGADAKKDAQRKYMKSEPGRHAVRRYKTSKRGSKAQQQSSERYEQTGKAKMRKNAYRQYKKVVREAVKRSVKATLKSEADHERKPNDEETSQPGDGSTLFNREAMNEIRSYKVSFMFLGSISNLIII